MCFESDIGSIEMKQAIVENLLYVNHPLHIKTSMYHSGGPLRFQFIESVPSSAELLKTSDMHTGVISQAQPFQFTSQLFFHHRGRHQFPSITMNLSDQLNLFTTKKVVSDDLTVVVHSDPAHIKKAKRASFAEHDKLLLPALSGLEQTTDFKGIREFYPGDQLRDIDWKASSRLQTLFTRLFEKRETINTIIFVDVSRSMRRRIGKQAKIDHAIAIVMQLTHILQNMHHPVGFVAFDEHKIVVHVSPTFDYQHIFKSCSLLPTSVSVSSYTPNKPKEVDSLMAEEPIEHQRFLSTLSPFLTGIQRNVKNRLHTTGVYQAVAPLLSIAKPAHLVFISDLETQTDALYSTMTLAHAKHHVQWLLTLFSPLYNEEMKNKLTLDQVEKLYKVDHARDQLLYKLRKKQVEIVNLSPSMQGMQVMQTVQRRR